jgi:uncharacterized protein YkwD/LysM repeat protein
MKKTLIWALTGFSLSVAILFPPQVNSFARTPKLSLNSSSYDLIDAVNSLRSSRGLSPYNSNSILMQIAQTQADYLASSNGANGHIGPGGTHPIDRAIAAGYPVSGGFISENWVTGSNLDAQGAINDWMGDAPHQLTMLSSDLRDIGAGVGQSGDFYYYVIDCGLATGSAPRPTTSIGGTGFAISSTPPTLEVTIAAAIVSTPDEKGDVYHIVQPGQTLWQIALAYKTTVNKIQGANGLTSINILAGQKLFISREGTNTPVPTLPTDTPFPASPTTLPTFVLNTLTPTGTAFSTPTVPNPLPAGAGGNVFAIILVALIAAGVIAWVGRTRSI